MDMDALPTSLPRHFLEEADNFPEMGSVIDSLIVSRADLEDFLEIRSQTSSMEADISTIPDVNEVVIDDPGDWMITAAWSGGTPLKPFHPSEKSLLIDGVGCWSSLVEPTFSWRLEAVNLEDISLEPNTFDIEPMQRPEFPKPSLSSHVRSWQQNCVTRSVAGSLPTLVEDSSRDSDSIDNSEALPTRDELYFHKTTQFALHQEGKAPLSPQLGSIGAAFVTQFYDTNLWPTLERNEGATALSRAASICESMFDEIDHDNSELDILKDGVSDDSMLWDDSSADSESFWMSDYSDDIHLLEDDHPFLLVRPFVVREALNSFQLRKHGAQGGSSSQATGETPSSSGTGNSDTSSGRKRKHEGSGGNKQEGGDKDGEDNPVKSRRISKKDSGHKVTFACPFAKKDPVKYRSCYAYLLKRIGDVKQHLSRYHQLPIYCPICMSCFDTEDQRDEHARSLSCTKQDEIRHEGVTRAQKAQLGQKVSSKLSSVDQWFTIFDILFPGHTPRPKSAYMNAELTIDLEGFQDLMNAEGPSIILNALRSRNIQMATIANEEHDLSALLLSAIEEGLQSIAQRWSESNLEEVNTRLEPNRSVNSNFAIIDDNSHRSQASSETLVEPHPQQHATEQYQNAIIRSTGYVSSHDVEMGHPSILAASSSQDLAWQGQAHHTSHVEQQGTATREEINSNHYYGETRYDVSMEDDVEFWKSFTQGDILLENIPESPDAPSS